MLNKIFLATAESENEITQNVKQEVSQITDFMSTFADKIKGMIPSLIFAIIVFILGIMFSRLLISILMKGLNKAEVDPTARSFLRSFVKISLYTLVVVITLSLIGVPMTTIVAVIGAAGLAIGLALQGSLSNLAGGFIILFSKPFKAGDYIETPESSGTVESISVLYTKLVTVDNKTVYIPNGNVSSGKVVNYTEKPIRRLDLEFSISYENDFYAAQDIIEKIVLEHEKTLKDPEYIIRMGRHDGSAIIIYLKVWVNTSDYWDLYYDMMEKVKSEFDENGIEIPYNQLDVHMKK